MGRTKALFVVLLAIGGALFPIPFQFVKAAPVVHQTRAGKTPIIRKISATSDRLEGGAQVEIKGKNFTPDTVVVVGDALATNTQIIKGKKIKFTVPPQKAPGVRNLSVWTPNGIAQIPFQILPKKLEELADGEITTIAGGIEYQNDGLDQMNASFYLPTRVLVDKNNCLFVADTFHHRIRRIDAKTGIATTIAGNGRIGFSGDTGMAVAASLSYPSDMAFDLSGNLLFVDSGNRRIRQINLTTGIINTFAGNGEKGFSGDGGLARDATFRFAETAESNNGIIVDKEGGVYIADTFNSRVRHIDGKTGIITTFAGGGTGVTTGDGGLATKADLCFVGSIALDAKGNLYIAEICKARIRKVDVSTNIISTIAGIGVFGFGGDGTPAVNAILFVVYGMFIDLDENIFLADGGVRIRRIDGKTGIINTIAGNGTRGTQLLNDGQLAVNVGLGIGRGGIGIDQTGNLLIVESSWNRIRSIDLTTGILSTRAGGIIPDIGDNRPALQARLRFQPVPDLEESGRGRRGELTFDGVGNLFLAETAGHRIRKIDFQTGIISTIAGTGAEVSGQDNQPATQTPIAFPTDLVADRSGNLLISEFGSHRVRRVDAQTGIVTTVAGNGSNRLNVDDDEDDPEYRFLDDNGPAVEASIANPRGIAMDEAGNLFISHYGLFVRRVDAQTQIITTPLGCCAGGGFRSLRGLRSMPLG